MLTNGAYFENLSFCQGLIQIIRAPSCCCVFSSVDELWRQILFIRSASQCGSAIGQLLDTKHENEMQQHACHASFL